MDDNTLAGRLDFPAINKTKTGLRMQGEYEIRIIFFVWRNDGDALCEMFSREKEKNLLITLLQQDNEDFKSDHFFSELSS